MTRRNPLFNFVVSLFFSFVIFSGVQVFSEEIIDNDYGWALDIPEGYKVAGYTPDGMSYQFKHDRLPVDLVMKLYPENIYSDPKTALEGTLKKLSGETEGIDTFVWRYTDCAICNFSTKVLSQKGSEGWAVSVKLPEKNTNLVLLCYADSDKADAVQQFMISTLNSLCIDRGSYFSPGIISTYGFNNDQTKKITLSINGRKIETSIKMDDEEAAEFLVDCEYSVLKFYAGNEKWKEAWQRYYKMIFRDSYSRLSKVAFDISTAFMPEAQKKNPTNPNAVLNEILLAWVQNFEYEREKNSSDFTNLIGVITGKGSDCDSRSLLLCCLMEQFGTKSTLFISNEYKHAVYGVDLNLDGAKIQIGDKWFVLNETTAKGVKPGLIAQDQNDTDKWIPVILP